MRVVRGGTQEQAAGLTSGGLPRPAGERRKPQRVRDMSKPEKVRPRPMRPASSFRGQRPLYQGGDGPGVLVAPLPQRPDDLPAALGGVVLVELPLSLDALDLDAEADDVRQAPLPQRPRRVQP